MKRGKIKEALVVEVSNQDEYFSPKLWNVVAANATLQALYSLTASEIFQQINNVLSVIAIAWCFFVALSMHRTSQKFKLEIFIATTGALATSILNHENTDLSYVLKYISIYAFFYAGASSTGQPSRKLKYILYITILTTAVAALGGSRIQSEGAESFSYFANKNTAVLFFSAVVFSHSSYFGPRSIYIQIFNCLAFQKIGAIVSTLLSVLLVYARKFGAKELLSAITLLIVFMGIGILGLLDRTNDSISNFLNIVEDYGLSGIAELSYTDLYLYTGTTDLSVFFRIKHWSEIISIFLAQDFFHLMLGYGPGITAKITTANLVPHNDYLLVLTEFGVLNFLIFIRFLYYVFIGIERREAKVLFLVLLIYFFSENLLNNFGSMSLYFGIAGLVHSTKGASNSKRTSSPIIPTIPFH